MEILNYALGFFFTLFIGMIIGKAFGYKQALEELANGSIELNIYSKSENIHTKILSMSSKQINKSNPIE